MSASIPLKQKVTELLPWLFKDYGLRVVEDDFDPESFGNSLVVLKSSDLVVRFVRDRGQVSAEVASPFDPGTWWNLEHVCELTTGRSVEPGFDLSSVAALVWKNLPAIIEALGPRFQETKRQLEQNAVERKRAFLRRLSQ